MTITYSRFASALLVVAALAPSISLAEPADFMFELVETSVPKGNGAVIQVRLMDMRDSSMVTGVALFAAQADMSPDGMAGMSTPVAFVDEVAPGIYQFGLDLTMEGTWRIGLTAKLPGEPEVTQVNLELEAMP
jgi:YtkA-like